MNYGECFTAGRLKRLPNTGLQQEQCTVSGSCCTAVITASSSCSAPLGGMIFTASVLANDIPFEDRGNLSSGSSLSSSAAGTPSTCEEDTPAPSKRDLGVKRLISSWRSSSSDSLLAGAAGVRSGSCA